MTSADGVSPARVCAPLSMTTRSPADCAHLRCSQPATDLQRGQRFCLGHFFRALQLDMRHRLDVAA